MSKSTFKRIRERVGPWIGPIFILVMLIASMYILHLELKEHSLQDFLDGLKKIPLAYLVLAIVLTVLNYAILVCYDWLGIWYIRHPMKFGRVALASFLGYAVGNNFGLLFGGSTIRYRLYSTWGLSTSDIVRLLFILAITFWIGLFALSGVVFLINPMPLPKGPTWDWIPFENTWPLGLVLTIAATSYLAVCALRRKPLKFKNVDCSPPPIGLALMQYLVAAIDLIVAASVMYALLIPTIEIDFFHFVTIFLMAQVAVFVTQVPGGIGVLEVCIMALLGLTEELKGPVFGALLAYRMIFYLTPMLIGLGLLVAHEITMNRKKLKPAFEALSRWTPDIAPRLLAFTAFSSGIILLFAAATPTTTDRIVRLNTRLPLLFIEASYVLTAMAGAGLLVVARGITHRVVSTYWVTLFLYGFGVVFSLTGNFGIEVAAFLMVMMIVHFPFRHYFFRDDVIYPDRIAITWVTAICVVLGVAFWLMWFAYKGGDNPMRFSWLWESGHELHAQRSLRALVAASIAFGVFTLVRTLRITLRKPKSVTKQQLAIARTIAADSTIADSQVALLGDKRFLMNAEKTAMLSYGIHGKSYVAYGDPIGPRQEALQVAWDFVELCKSGDNWPVFYNVSSKWLDIYSEMGLEITKIAQEAIVDLQTFDLSTSHRREFEGILKRFENDDYSFQVIMPPAVRDFIPVLARISDLWLRDGSKREYQFSVAFFDQDRIQHLPIGLAEKKGEANGFATVWTGADKSEISIGLLRYLPDAPAGMTEYLIVQTMIWGKMNGYKTLNLGLAPPPDDQAQQESPMRSLLAGLIFPHAEHVFTRHGLRNFKERFDPIWQPRYMASPGKTALKTILGDIAKLIHNE